MQRDCELPAAPGAIGPTVSTQSICSSLIAVSCCVLFVHDASSRQECQCSAAPRRFHRVGLAFLSVGLHSLGSSSEERRRVQRGERGATHVSSHGD